MPAPVQSTSIRVLDRTDDAIPPGPGHRALSVVALLACFLFAVTILGRIPEYERVELAGPIDIVGQLRDAFDSGAEASIEALLTDDAILTWPAGPPWGGPLSWSVELVTGNGQARLSNHRADLADFAAYYSALHGNTDLYRCNVTEVAPATPVPFYDTWVVCDFAMDNDLIAALDDEATTPLGRIRFGVVGDKISAVLVDSWDQTSPTFGYIRWIRDERPDSYEEIFSGRVTAPRYGADTAALLLELAAEYVTAG